MKTITIKETEVAVKVTAKEFYQMRESIIVDIINNTRNVYPKDKDMLIGIQGLCDRLMECDFTETTLKLVRGIKGFMRWSQSNMEDAGWVLTNIVHDLGEFNRNSHEPWFSPRTTSYSKFI